MWTAYVVIYYGVPRWVLYIALHPPWAQGQILVEETAAQGETETQDAARMTAGG
jgi:hypothetical protein